MHSQTASGAFASRLALPAQMVSYFWANKCILPSTCVCVCVSIFRYVLLCSLSSPSFWTELWNPCSSLFFFLSFLGGHLRRRSLHKSCYVPQSTPTLSPFPAVVIWSRHLGEQGKQCSFVRLSFLRVGRHRMIPLAPARRCVPEMGGRVIHHHGDRIKLRRMKSV